MKRSYALSQESGRKAAQWIRQEHADLFQHKVADPLIEVSIQLTLSLRYDSLKFLFLRIQNVLI